MTRPSATPADGAGAATPAWDFDGDAAVEQLYDELLARAAALSEVLTGAPALTRPDACRQLASHAAELVTEVRRGQGAAGSARVRWLLWPNHTRPLSHHAWWDTPLGRLLAAADGTPPTPDAEASPA